MEANYCPKSKSRWKTYRTYRIILFVWMLNDESVVNASSEIAHGAFYVHSVIYLLSTVCIGIPLIYSEMCLAQYSNRGSIKIWDFFPLFRSVGYASVYLVILKVIYTTAMCSYYLQYSFYAALNPPPWYSCDDFNTTKCMIKWVNVSVFQHCIEAQVVFNDDCGMKTASYLFFEREIGGNNSRNSSCCFCSWKLLLCNIVINLIIFILTIKREKFNQVGVKLVVFYVAAVIFVLFCISLSSEGTWFSTKMSVNWYKHSFEDTMSTVTRGFLSLGCGTGIIIYLSQDASFRSPTNMTAVATALYSACVCILLALVAFNGIKTVSYYHGEEQNIIEEGESTLFPIFASISEILSYFHNLTIWGFAWFSGIFLCLLMHLSILYLFLADLLVNNIALAREYSTTCRFLLSVLICICSQPFYCSDINGALADVIAITQLVSCLSFSVALYWIYGLKKHSVDIIFMIGVKSSYFWKIAWALNPIIIVVLLYAKLASLDTAAYKDSLKLSIFDIEFDMVVFYVLIALYALIVIGGAILHLIMYQVSEIGLVFNPTANWGPRDRTLYKSRQMFVPEIMTTEFLYRQVRIRGYGMKKRPIGKKIALSNMSTETEEKTEWSALTSN